MINHSENIYFYVACIFYNNNLATTINKMLKYIKQFPGRLVLVFVLAGLPFLFSSRSIRISCLIKLIVPFQILLGH